MEIKKQYIVKYKTKHRHSHQVLALLFLTESNEYYIKYEGFTCYGNEEFFHEIGKEEAEKLII